MRIRHIILLVAVLITVASVAWLSASYRRNAERTFQILSTLAIAQQSYVHDRVSRGQKVPESVTVQELVSAKYVSADEVRSLAGNNVTFYPRAISETYPDSILVRVRMTDGSQIAAFGDGHIAQLPYRP